MRPSLLALTLLSFLLLAGCAQEEVETQDIVSLIPWPDQERAEYVLLDRDGGEERGHAVLGVKRREDQFELRLRFEGEGEGDEAIVLVDATTLKPDSVRREVTVEGKTTTGDYRSGEGIVEIAEIDEDGDTRTVPLRLPEDYYDNESSLFLWRTIPFEAGYEASYHSVLVNQRGYKLARVKVAGKEEVTVPAGAFQAWRVEIRSGDVRQVAWYADTPERPLVQYDNSILLIQLTALPGD